MAHSSWRRRPAVAGLLAGAAILAAACAGAQRAGGAELEDVVGAVRALPNGGSSAWDAGVEGILLPRYDLDGSGSIDTPPEVDKIPCEVWTTLDRQIAEGGAHSGLRTTYGFRPGFIWVGGALGFGEAVRETADGRQRECGVPE